MCFPPPPLLPRYLSLSVSLFQTVKVSNIEKLTRYVDGSQLTNDLGGFLPYDHDQWLTLRQVSLLLAPQNKLDAKAWLPLC